jgi:hypothetical protein
MKNILFLFISLFYGFQSFAQDPDPNLFRTWYLYEIQASDLDDLYIVADIDPPIYPSITILETLEFNGEGACNTFIGTFSHEPFYNLESTEFTSTNDDCGIQIHNSFESSYYGYLYYFWYDITPDGNGLSLTTNNPIFGYAIFKDYPLSINGNNYQKKISLFPNPVTDQLFITSESATIEKITVYSMSGTPVINDSDNKNSIDVSNLSEGLYFIEISSSEGKSVQKFVKN